MAVVLMKLQVHDTEHATSTETHSLQKTVYIYANEDGYQLSPEFNSVIQAREWYAEMMSDYPYD